MSAFLDACHLKATPHTPIWLMRQAGRYQSEYRAIREKVSFLELCKTPSLATEVTLLPITQFGFDAAIIFADILLILEGLGVDFSFEKNHGPKIASPVRTSAQIDGVAEEVVVAEVLPYVFEAIRQTRAALPAQTALIGFAGAPFTVASYMIEGGGSRHFVHTKKLMYSDEGAWNALMSKVTRATLSYLQAQREAGADALQLFDSWVGCLSPADYRRYILPHMKRLFDGLKGTAPTIHFGTGNTELYPLMREAGGTVAGVDWRAPLGETWERLGTDRAIMGNLDPVSLLGPRDACLERARAVLEQAAGRPGHVFNLGHGILPETPTDNVRALVDFVHAYKAKAT